MNNSKKKNSNTQQTTFESYLLEQTKETFLKRIKGVEKHEKEALLKRYNQIIEELK
jgi:hypothetical protein